MREIVLDTETTGLNKSNEVCCGHRVIEIACLELIDGEITGRKFHSLLNPGRTIDPKAVSIHGITNERLKHAPAFNDIVNELLEFIGNSQIVIHNAPFDIAFLDQEFRNIDEEKKPKGRVFYYIDTLELARDRYPGMDNRLTSVAKRCGVDVPDKAHRALIDAQILAAVYIALA